jgi:DNA invertase Pin-like site-specific DNA recombinase
MAKIGHARVNTQDQQPQTQEDALKAAGARGPQGGRKPRLNALQVAVGRDMHAGRKYVIREIAETLGVPHMTVCRHLERSAA